MKIQTISHFDISGQKTECQGAKRVKKKTLYVEFPLFHGYDHFVVN